MTKRLAAVSLAVVALVASSAPLTPVSAAASPTVRAAARERLRKRKKIRTLLRRGGLAKLPSVSQALAGQAAELQPAAVSGTPPTLVSIPDASIKDLFWQPGLLDAIIAGTPTPGQCGQFWAGTQDGDSGGLGACHMAEGVGYSFSDILSGETSLCYMKTFPTADNLAAGAISLVAGAFPGDDPTRLFSVPTGEGSRVVEVDVSGDEEGAKSVFLRVHGSTENRDAGDLYAVDLWFCPPGASTPKGFNRIRIADTGAYTVEEQQGGDDGTWTSTVTGYVSFEDGRIAYDTTRSRHAASSSSRPDGSFKSEHTIAPDDTIASKALNLFGGGTNRTYTVSAFTGASAETLRFLAGAFKEQHEGGGGPDGGFTGSTEFRSTFYAASPASALEDRLAEVDFASDPFYATPPATTVDVSGFSCGEAPDVHVAIDFANPAGAAVRATCEHRLWERMHFCWEDPTVQAAQAAYPSTCFGPH